MSHLNKALRRKAEYGKISKPMGEYRGTYNKPKGLYMNNLKIPSGIKLGQKYSPEPSESERLYKKLMKK